jgi:hypothetical protein
MLLTVTGFAAEAPTVTLAWDPNEEEDVAGYRLHYGFRSGHYLFSTDVGDVTTATLPLPLGGQTYYFTATAYNMNGLESAFSNEVWYQAPEEAGKIIETIELALTTDEDQPVELIWFSAVLDIETTVLHVADPPALGRIAGSVTELRFEPHHTLNGSDACRLILTDAARNVLTLQVSIEITPANDPPVAYDSFEWTVQDLPISLFLDAHDVDGEPLIYEIVEGPGIGRIEGEPPRLTYWPDAGYTGLDQLTFHVSDGEYWSEIATVIIQVEPIYDFLRIDDLELETDQDHPIEVVLPVPSPNGDPVLVNVISSPLAGTLSGTPPHLVYTPDPEYHGYDWFSYAFEDAWGEMGFGLVGISVRPVNKPPVAYSTEVEMTQAESVQIVLEGSDPDGDDLTYQLIEVPEHGQLSGEPPELLYVPHLTFSGTDQIGYSVSDGELESDPATVIITVLPLEDPNVLAPRIIGIELLLEGQIRITCESRPGGIYRLLTRENMAGMEWEPASPEIEADGTTLAFHVYAREAVSGGVYVVTLVR